MMIALRNPLDWLHVEIVGVTIATILSHYFLADRTKLPYNLFYAHSLGGNGVLSTEVDADKSNAKQFAKVLWNLNGGASRFVHAAPAVTCDLAAAKVRFVSSSLKPQQPSTTLGENEKLKDKICMSLMLSSSHFAWIEINIDH